MRRFLQGHPTDRNPPKGYIRGNSLQHSRLIGQDKMLPESTRAFLRHAVGRYYAAVTAINEEGGVFRWQTTYHWTLLKFRDAAVRWACGVKLQFARRRFSHLTEHVPQATLSLYPTLITFGSEGRSFSVASALTQEIDRAEADAQGRAAANTGPARQ